MIQKAQHHHHKRIPGTFTYSSVLLLASVKRTLLGVEILEESVVCCQKETHVHLQFTRDKNVCSAF